MCHNYQCLLIGGQSKDGLYALTTRLENNLDTKAMFINLTRDSTVSYELLECINDGIAFNVKYNSGQIIWNPTWVWVFANHKPRHILSENRIYLYDMEQMKQGLEFTYEII